MTSMPNSDFIVIGAGIAGASVAYFLSRRHSVRLLEMEAHPGYHSTGRSAALFTETYGNATIRALSRASRGFFVAPPAGFAEHPLVLPRGVLFVGRPDQQAVLSAIYDEVGGKAGGARLVDAAEARRLVPVLKADYLAGGIHDTDAMDVDVHALHQGFLRAAKAQGTALAVDAEVTGLHRTGQGWAVETAAGTLHGAVVINAAGAWSDRIAALAGADPIGLVPKRRTVVTFAAPDGLDPSAWPMCVDAEEQFYFKPDAGRLIGSPADETPMPPCDVQPDEMDIALAVDRIERAADLQIRRIDSRWAGLRSFVADKSPVVGYDPGVDGFFWLAAQGGYGIQTAPALGRLAAELASGAPVPGDLAGHGVAADALAPMRPLAA